MPDIPIPALINSATIIDHGDPSVGICDAEYTVTGEPLLDTGVFAEDDISAVVEEVRKAIKTCFNDIACGKLSVMFDYEIEYLSNQQEPTDG